MNAQQRLALRAAEAIHEELERRLPYFLDACLSDAAWNACRGVERLIDKAGRHGWVGARNRLRQRLSYCIAECSDELARVRSRLGDRQPEARIPSKRDIFADLLALKAEFDEVRIDLPKTTIAVNTDTIVLQKIDLGHFRIVLDWSKLDHPRPYEVIANDPNPAASCSATTHPHVRTGHLCEGDGEAPIRNALRQGRLLDFFVLVRQVLGTYSPDNAYVKLSDWNGRDCSDCGCRVGDVNGVCCARCGDEVCSDCAALCTNCSEHFCSSHAGTCGSCDEPYCNRCLAACRTCGGAFCKDCLDEKQCPSCRQSESSLGEFEDCGADQADELDAADADGSDAPFHAVRLGQAAVPA